MTPQDWQKMEELLDTKLEQKLDQKLDEKFAVFETKFDYKLALLEARIDQKFDDFALMVKKGFDELHEKFDRLVLRVDNHEERITKAEGDVLSLKAVIRI